MTGCKRILVINGPNINLLGLREPDIYGSQTYEQLVGYIEAQARRLGVEAAFFQSNHEGDIIDAVQQARGVCDGIIINPAAFTHTSIAIPDALKAVALPAVEVHLSDIASREEYRRISYTSCACIKTICGKGFSGYAEALQILASL